jgi:SAM-dependent methyltransferase
MIGGPTIFDRPLLRRRIARARSLGPATFLIDRVAADLAERLDAVVRRFERAADIGTPGETLRQALVASGKVDEVAALELGDDEVLTTPPQSLDLAVSALALQFVNDLPGVLVQIRRALKPDGLLLAALTGGETLNELRQAFAAAESEIEGGVSPRVAPFADLRDLGGLLQRTGFALPVIDSERVTVRYDNAFALMADLRHMGATNALTERRRLPLRRKTLQRMAEIYAELFSDADGRVRATFEVIWLSGWVPHESQQQPLRPGSAKARLADALGVTEIPAGEKTGLRPKSQ